MILMSCLEPVSYTHLNDEPSIAFDVNTQLGKNATHEQIGAASVSYTHLDVYKRQVP